MQITYSQTNETPLISIGVVYFTACINCIKITTERKLLISETLTPSSLLDGVVVYIHALVYFTANNSETVTHLEKTGEGNWAAIITRLRVQTRIRLTSLVQN